MSVTMEQVRFALLPEEPDYVAAAGLGPEALPHLHELVTGGDPELATKAASLAGLIDDPAAADVLHAAAGSEYPSTRVAAAHATRQRSAEVAAPVLARLVTDDDAGVRKVAINAVPESATPELREALERSAEGESHAPLRNMARDAMARVRPK